MRRSCAAICRCPIPRGAAANTPSRPVTRAAPSPSPKPYPPRSRTRSPPPGPGGTATTCGTAVWKSSRPAARRRRSGVPPSAWGGRCAVTPSRVAGCRRWTWPARRTCATRSPARRRAGAGSRPSSARSTPRRSPTCPARRRPGRRKPRRRPGRRKPRRTAPCPPRVRPVRRQGPGARAPSGSTRRSPRHSSRTPSICWTPVPATRRASGTRAGSRRCSRPGATPSWCTAPPRGRSPMCAGSCGRPGTRPARAKPPRHCGWPATWPVSGGSWRPGGARCWRR